jgi:hypothetical protein
MRLRRARDCRAELVHQDALYARQLGLLNFWQMIEVGFHFVFLAVRHARANLASHAGEVAVFISLPFR